MADRKIARQKFDNWIEVSECSGQFYQVLPKSLFGLRLHDSRQKHIRERLSVQICPCCGDDLQVALRHNFEDETSTNIYYDTCQSCGFWKHCITDNMGLCDFTLPFTIDFNPQKEAQSLIQLASNIYKHPEILYSMDTRKFEVFVGSVLSEFYECDVWHVGCAGDDGVDLVVIEKEKPLLVQVKRREKATVAEGIDVVKLLFASAYVKGSHRGMVVTTAHRFSRVAKEWIHLPKLKDIEFTMDLVDVNKLLSMMHVVRPPDADEPWETHLYRKKLLKEAEDFRLSRIDNNLAILHANIGARRLYLFDLKNPGMCREVEMENSTGSSLMSYSGSSKCDIASLISSAHFTQLIEGDDLFSVMRTFDDEVMNQLLQSWGEADPEMVVNLMDYYAA